jgi:hypothetical protein
MPYKGAKSIRFKKTCQVFFRATYREDYRMEVIFGIGVIAGMIVLLIYFVMRKVESWQLEKLAKQEQGQELGQWSVYYDVEALRVGLKASFGEEHLLRFLIFRLHDLFSYYQGSQAEQEVIASAVRAAASGDCVDWSLEFPPAEGACYNCNNSPDGTLFKFFDGTLFEGTISKPRFMGGDTMAKHKGLLGECIAVTGHLAQCQPEATYTAVIALIGHWLKEGGSNEDSLFWQPAIAAFRMTN